MAIPNIAWTTVRGVLTPSSRRLRATYTRCSSIDVQSTSPFMADWRVKIIDAKLAGSNTQLSTYYETGDGPWRFSPLHFGAVEVTYAQALALGRCLATTARPGVRTLHVTEQGKNGITRS